MLTRKANKRHDEEMNEVKDKLIRNKLKQATPSKKKSVRVEGKEKEKEEALIKEKVTNDKKKEKALAIGEKSKASNRKQLSTTINKLDKKNFGE